MFYELIFSIVHLLRIVFKKEVVYRNSKFFFQNLRNTTEHLTQNRKYAKSTGNFIIQCSWKKSFPTEGLHTTQYNYTLCVTRQV